MGEPRTFASLSSGLLARKGGAKPAMRPQAFGHIGGNLDDLGWNDMGYGAAAPEPVAHAPVAEHVPSSIAALTPSPRAVPVYEAPAPAAAPAPVQAPEPPVVEQQRVLAESFSAPAAKAPAPARRNGKRSGSKAVAMPTRPSGPARDKAAFTLRLDTDRHFRLRLACAITGRSAQQIVTGALDDLLKSIPEVDALAGRMPAKPVTHS